MIVGYTQGTYDMFHIGHLNLLKNAKSMCDYLIVGINTDELILSYKSKSAVVPLEERMAIVEAIKYVDKVIPCNTLDKSEIYKKISFNKVFIGSDWKDSPRWIETERQMKKNNVEVVYLQYTKNTSSTLLREKLVEY